MKPTTKYPATDLQKECPMGTLHQKQCHACRLAISRFTENELIQQKASGDLEAQNKAWSCSLVALLTELQRLNKKLR